MNQSQDDEKLIAFLHQHRPIVPQANKNLEQEILAQLPLRNPQKLRLRSLWLIPTVVIAGLLVSLFRPVSQTAELETFMVNNWNEVMGESPSPSTSEASWSLLNELETEPQYY